ncbi:MAG: hypothetical protein BroJett013_22980 [Alphaproteobacteria bacterium]|nr:MAG: hypothetical protein BroJett013_22980 [Alphaproteobacteria bacterium]
MRIFGAGNVGGNFMAKTPLPWLPRGMNRTQAAAYIGVSAGTFDKLVDDGRMPKPLRIGARVIFDRWKLDAAFEALGEDEPNDFDNPWD